MAERGVSVTWESLPLTLPGKIWESFPEEMILEPSFKHVCDELIVFP